jgi:hypothetical protein
VLLLTVTNASKKNPPPKKTSQKASQKRKYLEDESEESSSASKLRRSSRVSSQSSNLTVTEAIRDLELVEPSTNRYDLPSSASKFYTEDIELLKVTFVKASAKNVVIPDVQNDQFQGTSYIVTAIPSANLII